MRRLTICLAAVLLALPAAAAWRTNATTATWYVQRATAEMQELRDALLWHYEGAPLAGALATSARPNVALTSIGGGNSELSIAMGLTAGNAWVTAYAARACPAAATQQERSDCADAAIKADLRRIWRLYREYLREQATPIVEPPPL